MSDDVHRAIREISQKNDEVFGNLAAHYDNDCLRILGEMANLINLSKLVHTSGQARLAGMIADQVAYMGPPLARLAKKDPQDVGKDLIALASARAGQIPIKPGGP